MTPGAAVSKYGRLVYFIAWKLLSRLPANVELDDLVQSGMEGLLKALGRCDKPNTTYFHERIKGEMLDWLRLQEWGHPKREASRIMKSADALEAKIGRRPTESEAAAAAGVGLKQYQEILDEDFSRRWVFYDDLPELEDFVDDRATDNGILPETRSMILEAVDRAGRNARSRRILDRLADGASYQEIAKEMRLSPGRISQLMRGIRKDVAACV